MGSEAKPWPLTHFGVLSSKIARGGNIIFYKLAFKIRIKRRNQVLVFKK